MRAPSRGRTAVRRAMPPTSTALTWAALAWAAWTGGPLQAQPVAAASAASGAASAPAVSPARAAERCEAAAAESLRTLRGRSAQEVVFNAGSRVVAALSGDETSVRGEGRYRGADGRSNAFGYSCVFDAASGGTSGVAIRDPRGAEADAPPANWQPDLSRVSPEACESAVAGELKRRYPRVDRIAFDGETRRLRPGSSEGRLLLEGQGAVQRAAGMAARPLRYGCELDARSARVLRVDVQD